MSKHSDNRPQEVETSGRDKQRQRLIGLGERSFHKSYYPELRKRLEELERFRTLLDQANDAIFLVRMPEAVLVDCNMAAARTLRRDKDDMLGMQVSELFEDMGREEVLEALRKPEGRLPEQELLCQELDEGGQCLRAMEMTFSVRDIGDERYAVIVARDVTQRVQAEQALREAEEKYRSIFEKALEGIFQVAYDGRLLSANPALAHILGYDSPEDLAASVQSISASYDNPHDRTLFLQDISRLEQVFSREMRFRRKDGTRIWVSITARLVRDIHGEPLFIEGFATDITVRKQAQQELAELNKHLESLVQQRTQDLKRKADELEEANQRLLELDAMKNVLLSSVSHELRTPLTSVMGFARLIQKDFSKAFAPLAGGDEYLSARAIRIGENLEIIRQESERLTRMINDFLDLSKIESGRIEWNDCEVQIADAVNGALQAVRSQIADKPGLELHLDMAPNLPTLQLDPDRLFQVVLNLVDNAVKFTEQGSIHVQVERNGDAEIHVAVADTGPGIPESDQVSIFSKFHQVRWEEASRPKPQGTGLGLAICKQIVEHYGGRIWATTRPEGGAVVHFTLPVSQGENRPGLDS